MFIPLPPGLAELSALRDTIQFDHFAPPPGLPPREFPGVGIHPVGELLRSWARASPAMVDTEGAKDVSWHPESVGTRCSTDEPPTPQAPMPPGQNPFEEDEVEEFFQPWCPDFEEAEIEKALEPVLKDILCQDKLKGKGKEKPGSHSVRWWTRPTAPLLCPLSGFPTCLLPYPPFKLRVDPTRSAPHRLVDGKFLAMTCIVTGRFWACGRELQSSDISALDDYIHRCKLGPYRPGRAVTLTQQTTTGTAQQRETAKRELERFRAAARAELGKVRRIQENRLTQIKQALPMHLQAAICLETPPGPARRR